MEGGAEVFWLCYGNYNGKRDIRLFINYLQANYRNMRRSRAYQYYVADVAKNVNEILATNLTGKYMQYYLSDILQPKKESTETAEEIVERIKHGLDEIGAENGCSHVESVTDA